MKNLVLAIFTSLVTQPFCNSDSFVLCNTSNFNHLTSKTNLNIDTSAKKMRNFVIEISKYAKEINPDFLIIPQNGIELCFNELEPSNGFHSNYMNSIDGIGVESLFKSDSTEKTNNRLKSLRLLKDYKKVFVSDYQQKGLLSRTVSSKNKKEGFASFPRDKENYDYIKIPTFINQENKNDVHTINDVKNYLYLINYSNFESKKQLLENIKNTNYDLILIDLFFFKEQFTKEEINSIKIKKNGGSRLVISYLNIGSAEKFRYYWKSKWKLGSPGWLEKKYEGYDDEIWVKFWRRSWRKIIYGNNNSYIKKITDAGFDGAYLDNVEAYYFLKFD